MLFHASIVALIAQYPIMQAISMCRDTARLATGSSVCSRSGKPSMVQGRAGGWLKVKIVAGFRDLGDVFLNFGA